MVDAAFRGHRGRAGFRDRADADPDAKPARGGRAHEPAAAPHAGPVNGGRGRRLIATGSRWRTSVQSEMSGAGSER
jgi:hypothetical protein